MPNLFLEGMTGGQTVYYIPPYDGVTNVTAFKPVSAQLGLECIQARLLTSFEAWRILLDLERFVGFNEVEGISNARWRPRSPNRSQERRIPSD